MLFFYLLSALAYRVVFLPWLLEQRKFFSKKKMFCVLYQSHLCSFSIINMNVWFYVYLLYLWYLHNVNCIVNYTVHSRRFALISYNWIAVYTVMQVHNPTMILVLGTTEIKAGDSGTSKEKWRVPAFSSPPGVIAEAAFPSISSLWHLQENDRLFFCTCW